MRFFEISSGVRLSVNEEEQVLLNRAVEKSIRVEELEERDGEVARNMVSRGLFHREQDDDGEFYTVNDCADLWRF
jgi:hypothetical protein